MHKAMGWHARPYLRLFGVTMSKHHALGLASTESGTAKACHWEERRMADNDVEVTHLLSGSCCPTGLL